MDEATNELETVAEELPKALYYCWLDTGLPILMIFSHIHYLQCFSRWRLIYFPTINSTLYAQFHLVFQVIPLPLASAL